MLERRLQLCVDEAPHVLIRHGGLAGRDVVELAGFHPLFQLAHELERSHAEEAAVVRVLHVLDPANAAYQRSVVEPAMKEFGDTVDEIWSYLLRARSRFRHVDPRAFLDPAVTSEEYVARYG